jgi:dolichyl-phosphate beta-glucosyltransferase
VCIFTDADLPFDMEAFEYAYGLLCRGDIDIVIGDRYLPDSRYSEFLSLKRRIASIVFSLWVRLFIAGGLFDTQCGLKGFTRRIAPKLFTACKLKRFGGDVEVLYLALKLNLTVRRIPVRLHRSGKTSVRLLRDGVPTIAAVATIPFNWYLGLYRDSDLESLRTKPYWNN